jgi:hypothetical protein
MNKSVTGGWGFKFIAHIKTLKGMCRVQGLSCPGFVVTRVCRVQGLSVQGLSCPGFVVTRVCRVKGLSVQGLLCPGFVVSRVCLSRVCPCTAESI